MTKVLVACERFGHVRDAFRKNGFDAYSCDLLPDVSNSDFHIQDDIRNLIIRGMWDLVIAHPPCTYTAVSGNKHYANTKERESGINFFMSFVKAYWAGYFNYLVVEHPVSVISTRFAKPTQYIQPYLFGEPYQKKTGLWLYNLPKLTPTNIVEPEGFVIHGGKRFQAWYSNRTRDRDETFLGVAQAMADQWGKYIDTQEV